MEDASGRESIMTSQSLAMVVYAGDNATIEQAPLQEPAMQMSQGPLRAPSLTSDQAPCHVGTMQTPEKQNPVASPMDALSRKVPNDLSKAEIRLKSSKSSSAELFLDKEKDLYVHPAGVEHYNRIQEKAEQPIIRLSSSDQRPSEIPNLPKDKEVRKLSDRINKCITQGSKHCHEQGNQ